MNAVSRLLLAILSCAALSGLSCGLHHGTPPVDAGPPPAAQQEPAAEDASASGDPEVALARGVLSSHRTGLSEAEVDALARTIVAEARRHELDPALVLAVMDVESNYDAYAVSPVGALGLMQIMPATGRELAERAGIPWRGSHTLFDPFVNVRLGVAYLRELSDRYGSLHTALAAYNWGPGHIDRRLRRGTPMPKQYPGLVFQAYGERSRQNS